MKARNLTVQDEKERIILEEPLSKNKTFKVEIQNVNYQCLSIVDGDENWIWHLRFGRLNFRSLGLLSKNQIVYGLPQIEQLDRFCEACIMAKHKRKPFQKEAIRRTRELLKAMYLDICGPFSVQSLGKNNYFITFMMKLLKQKSKAVEALIDFKCMDEK